MKLRCMTLQTFAHAESREVPSESAGSAAVALLRRAEGQYATAIERRMTDQMLASLNAKRKVRLQSARMRMRRRWRSSAASTEC